MLVSKLTKADNFFDLAHSTKLAQHVAMHSFMQDMYFLLFWTANKNCSDNVHKVRLAAVVSKHEEKNLTLSVVSLTRHPSLLTYVFDILNSLCKC